MNRNELGFYYFSNKDVFGTEVYYCGHFVGSIDFILPSEFMDMTDEELNEIFLENFILL